MKKQMLGAYGSMCPLESCEDYWTQLDVEVGMVHTLIMDKTADFCQTSK